MGSEHSRRMHTLIACIHSICAYELSIQNDGFVAVVIVIKNDISKVTNDVIEFGWVYII